VGLDPPEIYLPTEISRLRRHMGVSVVDSNRGDLDRVIAGIIKAIKEAKAEKGLQ
jgi:hypothetical protein